MILTTAGNLAGQTKGINREKYRIHIKKTEPPIKVDGVLEEEAWSSAEAG